MVRLLKRSVQRNAQRSAQQDGLWIARKRQILVSLALLAGCAVVARYSQGLFDNATSDDIPRLRQGGTSKKSFFSRIGKKASKQLDSQKPSAGKNQTTISPFHSVFDVVRIPVNPLSTLHDDVISIEHLPALSRVDVRLKHGARCPRPYLMGRLSGPALVLLHDWKWSSIRNLQENTKTTMLSGHYQVPDSGVYHLEIIALHCHDSLNNMKQNGNRQTHNDTEAWDIDIDKSMCMEDPWRHRLTEQTATLTIDHTVGDMLVHKVDAKGYWRNQEWLNNDECKSATPSPILTRFVSTQGPFWGEPSVADTRSNYDHDLRNFELRPVHESIIEKKVEEMTNTRICMIGSSQSHEQQHLFRLKVSKLLGNTTDTHFISSWGHILSPVEVTDDFARNLVLVQNCRKLVFFPWSESIDGKHTPTKIRDFYDSVHTMIENTIHARSSLSDDISVEIYVVSLRYRALDAEMTACPPSDWQSPPLIDAYNQALAKTCNEFGGTENKVTFLDTTPLVNPMWDYSEKSSPVGNENRYDLEVESLHLAKEILGFEDLPSWP